MNLERDGQQMDDDGLAGSAERLRASRVEPDDLALDRALATARARVASRGGKRQGFMKSRLAIVAVLTTGLAFSGTGATFALQGSSGSVNAAGAQYPPPLPGANTPGGQTSDQTLGPDAGTGQPGSGGEGSGVGTGTTTPEPDDQAGTGGEEASGGSDPSGESDPVQATRQVGATGTADADDLPFTGLAAIPLIAVGLAMLLAGALMQRARILDRP